MIEVTVIYTVCSEACRRELDARVSKGMAIPSRSGGDPPAYDPRRGESPLAPAMPRGERKTCQICQRPFMSTSIGGDPRRRRD